MYRNKALYDIKYFVLELDDEVELENMNIYNSIIYLYNHLHILCQPPYYPFLPTTLTHNMTHSATYNARKIARQTETVH